MKKKLSLLIVLVLILSLAFTGCGKKDPTPDIQAKATALMDAMVAGDAAKVAELVEPELLTAGGDLESFGTIDSFAEDFAEGIGYIEVSDMNETALAAIDDFKAFILENLVDSYELGEVKVDGDTATVDVKVNYAFDPDSIESVSIDDELNAYINTYTSEHMDELVQVLNDEGEDALNLKIVNDIIPSVLEMYGNALLEAGGMSEDSVIMFVNQDDNWVINGFKAYL